MKVTKTTVTSSETSATLELFKGTKVPQEIRDQIREDVGNYLVEQSLLEVAKTTSPIEGEGKFPALKAGPYRDKKKEELGTTRADIVNSGETLDEFTFQYSKEGIKIGVFGDRAPVADGHNNLSGRSTLPKRRWIPDTGQTYKPGVTKEIERIVADALADHAPFKVQDFVDVETKTELYDRLKSRLGDLSRSELKLAVYRIGELALVLKKLDLLRLL